MLSQLSRQLRPLSTQASMTTVTRQLGSALTHIPASYSGLRSHPVRIRFTRAVPVSEALAEIDARLSTQQFNHQAFAALQQHSAFVLGNLPIGFSTAANELFSAFDDFRAQSAATIQQFTSDGPNLDGYHPDGSFLFGSRSGPRFFIGLDNKRQTVQALPTPKYVKTGMKEANEKVAAYTDNLLGKVLHAIETGLDIPEGKLSLAFRGFDTKTAMNHMMPVTQERIQRWSDNNKLNLTEDGRIVSFLEHKDLVPLSILMYRNNETEGLELQTKNHMGLRSYRPVTLKGEQQGGIRAVVLLGRVMENFTNGQLEGGPHRVVSPVLKSGQEFSRDSINVFVFVDPHVVLQPVHGEHKPEFKPITSPEFFAHFSVQYTQAAEKAAVKTLPAGVIETLPTDADIETYQAENNRTVYRRR